MPAAARTFDRAMSHLVTDQPPVAVIGNSTAMNTVRELARRIAGGDPKVLITGESGVGKDVVARYIHGLSTRASRPFVAVNCAAISETLLESELFGHVKGSFTGAYRDKIGRLQLADRGTVFFDELGETSPRMQALLLRFLENGEIHPVGSEVVAARVNVRVIAATNRDLASLVSAGQFREDLLYRIKVVHLHIPPLRERIDDLPALIEYLLERIGRRIRFDAAALARLSAYSWPGNVRELQNVLEQTSWTAASDVVRPGDLPPALRQGDPPPPADGRERRRQVADDLYQALTTGELTFWDDVYTKFLRRDLTRRDVRELVTRGLDGADGSYRSVLSLFRIPPAEYKRFMNFLAAHGCAVDVRAYRAARRAARQN